MRRKRGGAGGGGDEDSSGSSAIDSKADSMRPLPPARKRRRTFLDAFSGLGLKKNNSEAGEDCDEDADSSQAVADETAADGYSTTSSLEDDEYGDNVNIDGKLLSDREEVERKVMLELVLGPNSELPGVGPKDAVDKRLQDLIRSSLRDAASPGDQSRRGPADDTTIEPSYARSTSAPSSGMDVDPLRRRSDSLPDDFVFEGGPQQQLDVMMDMDSTDPTQHDSSSMCPPPPQPPQQHRHGK